MRKRKNSECVSLETNILFLIGAISRVFWINTSSLSDLYLTYLELFLGFSTLGYAIYLYQKNKSRNFISNEIKMPIYLKLYVLLPSVTSIESLAKRSSKLSVTCLLSMLPKQTGLI